MTSEVNFNIKVPILVGINMSNQGTPLSDGTAKVYLANSTQLAKTYKYINNQFVEAENPVTFNVFGFTDGTYFVDSNMVEIRTFDKDGVEQRDYFGSTDFKFSVPNPVVDDISIANTELGTVIYNGYIYKYYPDSIDEADNGQVYNTLTGQGRWLLYPPSIMTPDVYHGDVAAMLNRKQVYGPYTSPFVSYIGTFTPKQKVYITTWSEVWVDAWSNFDGSIECSTYKVIGTNTGAVGNFIVHDGIWRMSDNKSVVYLNNSTPDEIIFDYNETDGPAINTVIENKKVTVIKDCQLKSNIEFKNCVIEFLDGSLKTERVMKFEDCRGTLHTSKISFDNCYNISGCDVVVDYLPDNNEDELGEWKQFSRDNNVEWKLPSTAVTLKNFYHEGDLTSGNITVTDTIGSKVIDFNYIHMPEDIHYFDQWLDQGSRVYTIKNYNMAGYRRVVNKVDDLTLYKSYYLNINDCQKVTVDSNMETSSALQNDNTFDNVNELIIKDTMFKAVWAHNVGSVEFDKSAIVRTDRDFTPDKVIIKDSSYGDSTLYFSNIEATNTTFGSINIVKSNIDISIEGGSVGTLNILVDGLNGKFTMVNTEVTGEGIVFYSNEDENVDHVETFKNVTWNVHDNKNYSKVFPLLNHMTGEGTSTDYFKDIVLYYGQWSEVTDKVVSGNIYMPKWTKCYWLHSDTSYTLNDDGTTEKYHGSIVNIMNKEN